MGQIKHPNVVEQSDLILNTSKFNYSAETLKKIITDLCKTASDENKMKLVTVYFLNDGSSYPNDSNCIGHIKLPIFPHTFNIDDNIFNFTKRIYLESSLISDDLDLSHKNFQAFGKPVSLIFGSFPKLCEKYLTSFSDESFGELREAMTQMSQIAKTNFPDKQEAVEHYIKTCVDKTAEMAKLFQKFTVSCNNKKEFITSPEQSLKFDTIQVQRLLNHIYNNFNKMFYVASEWCHEKDEHALKTYQIYDSAEEFFMRSTTPYESKVYDSAFSITTMVLEMSGIENTLKGSQPGDDDE